MNVLMLTLMYPEDELEEVSKNAKDKLQNQINNYQRAFIEGIRCNLLAGEQLSIVNSLPVGIFPLQYKKLILRSGFHDQNTIFELGTFNLPFFKQKIRKIGALHAIRKWANASPENRTVLLYTQYLPYVEAVLKVKTEFPDLKAAVIVTDLPNEFGLPSGRRGFPKKIEYYFGKKSMDLCRQLDGFVLLTKPMAEALHIENKPYEVIEGLIQKQSSGSLKKGEETQPAVLYTGTLEPDLGIAALLDAFRHMPEYQLWICGQGSMTPIVEQASKKCGNIHFYGFVAQKEALALQAKASALINPRLPDGLFTRYSFPSKTLEYLRSGKPVLCYKLDGIPDEYDHYLCYIQKKDAAGIENAVRELMKLSDKEREQIGECGRHFVLNEKNPAAQCVKLLHLLRRL